MYNPSRGGVRGGADQFTWESVKNDKHRENYLGHSLMAPVGRWQKGKDLSWYAKERKDTDKSEKSELASIKQAEEEAMLIALGHNIVRKTQTLSKEDVREALKRNTGERDDHNIERIDGVGASSQRVALLSGVGKDARQKSEGIAFEGYRERKEDVAAKNDAMSSEERRRMKKPKKHKKEKKHNKHREESDDSDSSESDNKSSSKTLKHRKEKKHKKHHKDSSPDPDLSDCDERKSNFKNQKEKKHKKHHRTSYDSDYHDNSSRFKRDEFDSENKKISDIKSHKLKKRKKYHKESYDSDSSGDFSKYRTKHRRDESDDDDRKFSNTKSNKKFKHKDNSNFKSRKTHNSNDEDHEKYKNKTNYQEKRRRHDTSESE